MLFILISIFCGIMILIHSGQNRFNWFVCSMLLLASNITIIDSPQIQSHRFFILCFWLSAIYHQEYKSTRFPILLPLVVYIVGVFCIGWHDKDLTVFYRVWKPLAFLLDSYFILLLAFWGTKNVKTNSRPIVYVLFVTTIYGIFTYIIKANPVYAVTNPESYFSYFQKYCFGDRIRISSTWSHPIAYGLICSIFATLQLSHLKTMREKALLSLLVINILICGSRTALASLIMMLSCYVLFRYKLRKTFTLALRIIPLAVAIYLFVPSIQSKVDQLVDTVMGVSSVEGSSLDMRQMQTAAVLMIYSSSPVWGHGPDYVQEQLRPDKKLMNLYTTQGYTLFGFESYAYIILIERGMVGVVLELLLMLTIIVYGVRNKKLYPAESANILSIMSGFMFFALSTGALDTWKFTMLFIGLFMRRIYEREISDHHSCL